MAKKELQSFFSSPMAYIFLGVFLFVLYFVFFWVEGFFVRNIADVRPLFDWMPILLIFLVSALTMRLWSEERRMGTIEFLFTLPVPISDLVVGKFLACLVLVCLALLATLGLPLTVSFLGLFDWGPVLGSYLATLLLASSYIAIGLYISSKNESQIISLILTVMVCGLFYLVGSSLIGGFFGHGLYEFFKLLGSGSRFESIQRGVIDIRDLYYYISITVFFLCFTVFSLEKFKWSGEKQKHRTVKTIFILLGLNLLLAHVWLYGVKSARVDLTSHNVYTLSSSTKNILKQLREPLLIRGYFSAKSHPLLAPLVPQIRDTLEEYQVAGGGKVRAEFIDPRNNEELEAEANQKYGIRPVPFRFSDRYQAELVNSYFNILIQYGDQFEVLNFDELIEVKQKGQADLDVRLKNLEYDITRNIKKVMYGFNNTGMMFSRLKTPLHFIGYVTEKNMPQELAAFKDTVNTIVADYQKMAGDKLTVEYQDPSANPSLAKEIDEKYGFKPMALSLADQNTFYFYMIITDGNTVVSIQLPEGLKQEELKNSFDAAFKRFSPGFLKTVGLVEPPAPTPTNPNMPFVPGKFQMLDQLLNQNFTVNVVDLKKGYVDETVDVLLVVSPTDLSERELFAIDQFLMRGGSVILATSPYTITQEQQFGITASKIDSGLTGWLASYGITIPETLVLDAQNASFPVAINRQVSGFTVREIQMVNYPYSVDIRQNAMNEKSGILSGMPQLTFYWASPLNIDADKNKERKITNLFYSSDDSWTSDDTGMEPNFELYPTYGFDKAEKTEKQLLGAVVEGEFESYFKDKAIPLESDQSEVSDSSDKKQKKIFSKIDHSPKSARLIVYSSNEFLSDQSLQLARAGGNNEFMNNLQLADNTLNWATEDEALLGINKGGQFSTTMIPLSETKKMLIEYGNYMLALLGIGLIYVGYHLWAKKRAHVFSVYKF
ncbi:Gldg family protein [bacterium]|nr:Gldg family protein [bacterium]